MWETLNNLDISLFLFLNNMGTPALDEFFMFITDAAFIPFAIIVAYLLFTRLEKKTLPLALVLLAVAILCSDQLCGNVIRDMNIRLRPCHMEELEGMFRSVRYDLTGYCGGMYGFVSSHAGNAFALAVFSATILQSRVKYIWWGNLFFAILIGYSRVYIGTHITGDVIVGGAVGAIFGYASGYAYNKISPRILRAKK